MNEELNISPEKEVFIKEKIDIGENFFNESDGGIFTDAQNFLDSNQSTVSFDYNNLTNFPNHYWNESIAKEILFFLNKVKRTAQSKDSEIYEKEDGTIDYTYLNDEITFGGKYSFNFADIKNADAGYNFCKESEIYRQINKEIVYIVFTNTKNNEKIYNTFGKEEQNRVIIDEHFLDRYFSEEIKEEIIEYFGETFKEQITADFFNENGGIIGVDFFNKLEEFGIIEKNNEKYQLKNLDYDELISKDFINRYGYDNDLIFYGTYENKNVLMNKVVNPWVMPWYNKDGKTYKLIRNKDRKDSVLSDKEHLNFTRDKGKNKNTRLIMPRYKRKVEVEDLNRNFWVISQAFSAIGAYLFNDEAPMPKILGSLIGEIIQLWDNTAFLNVLFETLNKKSKNYPIHKEIVYIGANELKDYMKYDDFSAFYNQLNNFEDYSIKIKEPDIYLKRKKRNLAFEEAVCNYLSRYSQIYSDYNVVLIPIVRLSNYKDGCFSRIIIPGEYIRCRNYENFMEEENILHEEEEITVYNALKNAGDIINNIFHIENKILVDIDAPWSPSSNLDFEQSFIAYTDMIEIEGETVDYYSWDIDLSDYTNYIYGICENSTEDGFIGCECLQQANKFQIKDNKPFYGICELYYNLPISYYKSNNRWRCFPVIRAVDLARRIFNYPNDFNTNLSECKTIYEDNTNFYETTPKYNVLATFAKMPYTIEFSTILGKENRKLSGDKSLVLKGEIGYYLNELLSTYRQSLHYKYGIITFDQQKLRPTNFKDSKYLEYYRNGQAGGLSQSEIDQIEADKINDEASLTNFLSNFVKYYSNVIDGQKNPAAFWDDNVEISNDLFRIGYTEDLNNEILSNRISIQEGLNNNSIVWGNENNWKEDAEEYFNNFYSRYRDTFNNFGKTTILFVSGERVFQAIPEKSNSIKAINSIEKDGLLSKVWKSTSTISSTIGAAIRIPIGDGESEAKAFYPKHVRALSSSQTKNKGKGLSLSNPYVPRHDDGRQQITKKQLPYFYEWDTVSETYVEINQANVSDDRIYALPLIQTNKKNNGREVKHETYATNASTAGASGTQYQILMNAQDEEISLSNWLILKIDDSFVSNAPYALWSQETDLKNDLDANAEFQSFTNFENKLESISFFSQETYQKILNRRFIRARLIELFGENYETNKNCTIKNLIINKDSQYYLNMENWFFGWAKIYEKENNRYTFIGEFLCNGYDCTKLKENKDKVLELSKKDYRDCTTAEVQTLVETLQLINNDFLGSNTIDKDKKYVIINKFYSNRDIEPDNIIEQQQWFEDAVILRNNISCSFKEQEELYKIQSIKTEWGGKFSTMVENFKEIEEDNFYEIENWIFPLEGKVENFYSFSEDSSFSAIFSKFNLNDKIYVENRMVIIIEFYLFGPEDNQNAIYANRGIIRYGTEKSEELEKMGKWPNNSDGNYWYDNKYLADNNIEKSIDDLRDGYEVIQVDNPNKRNIELFKSNIHIESNTEDGYNKDDLDMTRKNKGYIPSTWTN